jgi:hypothetical protein
VAAPGAALVGDRVSGDLEQPDAERRRSVAVGRPGPLLEPAEVGERGEECPLGDVLGLVMIAELVEREAVHLGEIPAVEGVEQEGIALGRLDEGPVAVEMGDPGWAIGWGRRRASGDVHPSQSRSCHPVTPHARRSGSGRA